MLKSLSLGLFASIVVSSHAMGGDGPARPNIVIILADDMGYGDPHCYNPGSRIPTPNMDRLAGEGIRFTDAHSGSAVCSPSRYGILTGRYCWRTRLKKGVLGADSPPLIEPGRLTIAGMLKHLGYSTACIGKWHLGVIFHDKDGNPVSDMGKADLLQPVTGGPLAGGFDMAYYTPGCGTTGPPYGFVKNERYDATEFTHFDAHGREDGGSSGPMAVGWESKKADVILTHKACDYIRSRKQNGGPFFLYLTPNSPHEPCSVKVTPELARGKSRAGSRGDLVWLFDWTVGEVMKTLEETGQARNTIVIVSSDNGGLPGDYEYDGNGRRRFTPGRNFLFNRYGHKSDGDLRGLKAHIWEGGHRVPLIIRWPGHIRAGRTTDALICLNDLMATCAAITGAKLPANAAEDSISQLPVLEDRVRDGSPSPRISLVNHSCFGAFAIRKGSWKLIEDTGGSGGWPPPRDNPPQPDTKGQLYDLKADPGEIDNLWDKRPDKIAELHSLLDQIKN